METLRPFGVLQVYSSIMVKWLVTVVLVLVVFSVISQRYRAWRLPGDIDIQRNGQRYSFPIGSTVMLSLLASLIYWMLR